MDLTPEEVYRSCAEASWDAPGTRLLWRDHQRETYIALMLRRPDWRAQVDTAYRAGREAAARAAASPLIAVAAQDPTCKELPRLLRCCSQCPHPASGHDAFGCKHCGCELAGDQRPETVTDAPQQVPPADIHITPRMREILNRVARGQTYTEIGAELNIAFDTVKTHLNRMYHRLGVRNKTSAVVVGYRLGLIGDTRGDRLAGREQRGGRSDQEKP